MGRLIVSAQMTLDSVMDQNDKWFNPDPESEQDGEEELRAADALVLGRTTYEFLSSDWPKREGVLAELVNVIPKFAASRTIEEPLTWNARLLGPDPADAVSALKAEHSGHLLSYGCGELANHLARRGLVDEVRFWLHPVVWGDGVRPFHAGELPMRLRLIGAKIHLRRRKAVIPALGSLIRQASRDEVGGNLGGRVAGCALVRVEVGCERREQGVDESWVGGEARLEQV